MLGSLVTISVTIAYTVALQRDKKPLQQLLCFEEFFIAML